MQDECDALQLAVVVADEAEKLLEDWTLWRERCLLPIVKDIQGDPRRLRPCKIRRNSIERFVSRQSYEDVVPKYRHIQGDRPPEPTHLGEGDLNTPLPYILVNSGEISEDVAEGQQVDGRLELLESCILVPCPLGGGCAVTLERWAVLVMCRQSLWWRSRFFV